MYRNFLGFCSGTLHRDGRLGLVALLFGGLLLLTTAVAGGHMRISAEHPADPTVFLGIDLGSELHGVPGYACGKLGYGECRIDAVFLGKEGELMYDRCALNVFEVSFSAAFKGPAAKQEMEGFSEKVDAWLRSDGWLLNPEGGVFVKLYGTYAKADSIDSKTHPRIVEAIFEPTGQYRVNLAVEYTQSSCSK